MVPYERYELIIKIVRESKFVSINSLLKTAKSSLTTLRRDINYLSEKGKIKKTRGGITFVQEMDNKHNTFLYTEREKRFPNTKESIGMAAQDFINNEEIIFITNGTTTYQVAKNIDENKHVTVITNGLDIVNALINKPNVNVIILGGIVNYSHSSIVGPSIPRTLDEFNPSKVIMGAGGITEEKGITIYDYIYASYLQKAIEGIKDIIVVADHSKFGRNILSHIIPLNKISTIITDDNVPPEFIDIFKKYEINYLLSPANE